jgi:hypothetical protein
MDTLPMSGGQGVAGSNLSSTPADNITEVAECRSVRSPTEDGSPARLAAVSSARSRRGGPEPDQGLVHEHAQNRPLARHFVTAGARVAHTGSTS